MCLCVLVCVNFGDEIVLRGEECKTRGKLEIFKNGKMIIKIINGHNGSGKPRKFFRSRITKWTGLLNSSHEI